MIWTLLIISLLFLYILSFTWFAFGFIKTSNFNSTEDAEFCFSIIICARDEEKNIGACLNSILEQAYSFRNIQIIFVNDASTDHTSRIAESILVQSGVDYSILQQTFPIGKKASITSAIKQAKHPYVILRDADTFTLSKYWLKSISNFLSVQAVDFVIAPIALTNHQGLLWALQCVENNVLAILTAGSAYYKRAFLCSGANLIFKKSVFEKVNGFSSHLKLPSGDDVLFLEDVKKLRNSKISYLKSKDALVYTYPCFSVKSLIDQKIRWASKFKANPNKINLKLGFLTFLVNLIWFIAFISYFAFGQLGNINLLFLLLKLVIDILLLFLASQFIQNKWLLWYALPVALIYPLYAIIISIGAVFFKPKWKS